MCYKSVLNVVISVFNILIITHHTVVIKLLGILIALLCNLGD